MLTQVHHKFLKSRHLEQFLLQTFIMFFSAESGQNKAMIVYKKKKKNRTMMDITLLTIWAVTYFQLH